ncbi:hypothetical protein T265_05960 [Opisthorchis viverrini]|uniref:Eukaryotic translation initiation factor 4C n=1 Tax=Opisthorchis viverrini TaxID=6198 RepID=A0A074ZMA7_OPIVI|nr:hypothetical protein T265_05960 [Opisthorchis viverrini]KER26907.1 hypothetical protein T265_05960 [Opisthorchis viverrini]
MPKNKGKGGKNRRRGKNENESQKRELIYKEAGQEYAKVERLLGNGRLEAYCFDGVKRLCHIRGKLRKKRELQPCASTLLLLLAPFKNTQNAHTRDYQNQLLERLAEGLFAVQPNQPRPNIASLIGACHAGDLVTDSSWSQTHLHLTYHPSPGETEFPCRSRSLVDSKVRRNGRCKDCWKYLKAVSIGPFDCSWEPLVSEIIRDQKGSPICSKAERLDRWARYFDQRFSWPPATSHPESWPSTERWAIDMGPPPTSELSECISLPKCHRAAGSDDLPSALFRDGGGPFSPSPSSLVGSIWVKATVSDNWGESIIVPISKKVWISNGDIILVGLRDYQDKKADVIMKYLNDEARTLKSLGEIPDTVKLEENNDIEFDANAALFEEDGEDDASGSDEDEEDDSNDEDEDSDDSDDVAKNIHRYRSDYGTGKDMRNNRRR